MRENCSVLSNKDFKEQIAHLSGYLEAIASIQGDYRDQRMGVLVIGLNDSLSIQSQLQQALHQGQEQCPEVLELNPVSRWTDIENYFREQFLQTPFGMSVCSDDERLNKTRRCLAWEAADQIGFLSGPDFCSPESYRVVLSHPALRCISGFLLKYLDCMVFVYSYFEIENPHGFSKVVE